MFSIRTLLLLLAAAAAGYALREAAKRSNTQVHLINQ